MLRRRTFLAGSIAAAAALAGCAPDPVGELVDEDGAVTTTHEYGDDPAQVCDLILPSGEARGTVILVHGGFWQAGYDRSLEDAVAADLVADGYAVWNVDYRGVGAGGGYPATFADLAAAVDLLATVGPDAGVAIDRVAIVGHSAGGHLALWAAGRHLLPEDAPGANPALSPIAACSQAGVNDLVAAQAESVGGGAVASILGIGPDVPVPADLAATTSPQQMLPLGVPQLIVTGDADVLVPPWLSEDYAPVATAAGDDVRLEVVAGEDHFAHLDPGSDCWAQVRAWLIDVIG
ncbi:alpha/beta hydrolase [Agrococcus jejuensis]|uniref:Acetyl esterase/lipase n=1 Tax=Agrococcus jejuensis TaxID=399736 RepID=A0A1G8B7I2_9MICO|nr:alpha/beta hydrolase [Agrococcus jejuensis]SDH29189.1 Acetyl esterase/lipase [Agrococcus jejuensis]